MAIIDPIQKPIQCYAALIQSVQNRQGDFSCILSHMNRYVSY